MNTPQKGSVRSIVFKDGDTWYGVALEFNIVESGDDFDVVMFNLHEAIRGYVESQRKIKGGRYFPLNQKADHEYEEIWTNLHRSKPIPSPYDIKYYGVTKI
jgi:predicted RNase H-like HicB family nuclease